MNSSIPEVRIPAGATKYLLPQRTDYRDAPVSTWGKLYGQDVDEFARHIGRHLPSFNRRISVLDVGCGLGIGLLALARVYGTDHEFFGLDKDKFDDNPYFGLKEKASAYNSLDLTREVLALNGLSQAIILEADRDGFPVARKFDIIVSLIAWGFHFPARTYAAEAHQALRSDGWLVIDLRTIDGKDAGGLAELDPYFDLRHQIQGRKYMRSFFQRKG